MLSTKRKLITLLMVQALLLAIIAGIIIYFSSRSHVLGASDLPSATWCFEFSTKSRDCFEPTPLLANETAYHSFLRLAQQENIVYSAIKDNNAIELISIQNSRANSNLKWSISISGIQKDLYTYVPKDDEVLTMKLLPLNE